MCELLGDTSKDGESALNEKKMGQFLPGTFSIENQIKPFARQLLAVDGFWRTESQFLY